MSVIEQAFHVDAPAQAVWDVMCDVERWPEWTASMKKVVRLDGGPLAPGSKARLWISGTMTSSVWTVTSFEPGRSFTWESRIMPGVLSIADHEFAAEDGGTRAVLRVTLRGPLSPVVAPFLAGVSRRNMKLEGEGLKRRAEGNAAGSPA